MTDNTDFHKQLSIFATLLETVRDIATISDQQA